MQVLAMDMAVALALAGLGIAIILILPRLMRGSRNRRLQQHGAKAPATIIETTDTGNRFNSNPEVLLSLQVMPPGGMPFRAETRAVISVVDLPKYPVGSVIQVCYDPEDTSQVVLDR